MYHKGLSRQIIIDQAIEIIQEEGEENFSLHILASRLGVKTASLYTHIHNLEDVLNEVGLYSIALQKEYEMKYIGDLKGAQAIKALAKGYYEFAINNRSLYKINMNVIHSSDVLMIQGRSLKEPIEKALADFELSQDEVIQWQRILRCIMHGYIDQQDLGFFNMYKADKEEAYNMAIQCFIDGLNTYIQNKKG